MTLRHPFQNKRVYISLQVPVQSSQILPIAGLNMVAPLHRETSIGAGGDDIELNHVEEESLLNQVNSPLLRYVIDPDFTLTN